MNTTKVLALAAAAVMSLGVATSMAQEGPSMPTTDSPALQQFWRGQAPSVRFVPQAGSSDIDTVRAGAKVPPAYDYGDIANPG
jgi:hypothetical protein